MSVFTPKRQPGVQVKPVEGQVGVNYILGPGDTLKIEIWGGPSEHLTRVVDREGRVGIPEVGQVAVAGQSVADAQRQILNALKHEYREVTVDVSVARLRTTRVYVVGDVKNPGAYSVTGDATPLTLMIAAGGPTDSGTMRHLKHFRGSSLVADVDLYRFLLNGLRTDAQPFADGDTLLVPPVGPQVAVLGQVRRPAIYELKEEETLEETLALAGGVQVSGSLSEVTIDRVDPHGGNRTLTLKTAQGGKTVDAQLKSFAVQDGDRVAINAILPYREQTIYVQGHVFHPGRRGFHPGMTFTDLLGSYTEFLPEPADRAEIVRLSPPNYRPVVIPVSLNQIFNEHQAVALQPFDTVRIFGRYEEDIPKVTVEGDIVRPGQYPLSEGMKVSELVRLAGGLKRGAYAGIADLTTYQVVSDDHVELRHDEVQLSQALAGDSKDDLMLKPGDVLGIRQMTGWSNIGSTITIRGEVRYPGTFGIAPGDTLSSVLLRAGGFTEGAYPYGAVLNREQVRELALQSRDALVRKLKAEANVVSNKTEDQDKVKETEATRKQMILDLMSEPPSGRLAIDVGSDIKVWQGTVADIQVRPGDDLVIPKNMGFVMVNGQVYSPTALAYNPHRDAKWYLQNAGGLTRLADARNIFIIKANGRVVSARSSPLLGGGVLSKVLQPGDTIVVPQKLNTGSSIWKDLMQSAQLMSALAITAIAAGHL